MVRSRYARGAVKVRSWCGQGTFVSRYVRGAVEVRSPAVLVLYGTLTLTFYRAVLYMYIHMYMSIKARQYNKPEHLFFHGK